ncbi:MAG TPA: VanZ family protein [Burkholderiales bacterium]|nr:VanZ family protein [Burkholderiales bacterium]
MTPFTGWRDPGVGLWSFLLAPWSRHIRRFDIFINFFAYIPLGFLLSLVLQSRLSIKAALTVSTLCGFTLSLGMEAVQIYLPARSSSTLDLLTNGLGGFAGALIAAREDVRGLIAVRLAGFRDRWFIHGSLGDLGLVLLGLWFVSQLNPSLPLLGIVFFSESVNPVAHRFSLIGSLSVMCNLVSIGLLLMALMRTARAAIIATLVLLLAASVIKLLAAAVLLKPEALLQWLTAESVIGIGYGLFIVAASLLLTIRQIIPVCAFALAAGIFVAHLHSGEPRSSLALHLFSWHYGHLLNFTGLARITAELWPFAALGYLCLLVQRLRAGIRHRV